MSGKGMAWLLAAGVVVAVTVLVAVKLLLRLLRTRRLLREAGIPASGKVAFWAAVGYLVLPVDLLPEPILLDDIGFLLLALRSLDNAATRAGIDRLRLRGESRTTAPRRPWA
ncbi:hypothetical protein [Streptomyces sp. 8N616]|uniref:hypothetical protein n=1 Tax=Streptomyces sp. 8N616 TaxID=3457414 RepID=UPI003FD29BCC